MTGQSEDSRPTDGCVLSPHFCTYVFWPALRGCTIYTHTIRNASREAAAEFFSSAKASDSHVFAQGEKENENCRRAFSFNFLQGASMFEKRTTEKCDKRC